MATRQRTVKTAAELKAEIEKKRREIAELEQKAYASELDEAVKNLNAAKVFADIKAQVKGASDVAILAAIGKAAKVKRLEITQKDAIPRKKKQN
jgi:hypothetical protein